MLGVKCNCSVFWNSICTILFVMSVENIILFYSVLDEALKRLGKKNLKLKECQYEAVKAVVVDRKDTICILPIGHGKSLIYQLLPYCRLLNLFICNACAVRVDHDIQFFVCRSRIIPETPFPSQGIAGSGNEIVIVCCDQTFWSQFIDFKSVQLFIYFATR